MRRLKNALSSPKKSFLKSEKPSISEVTMKAIVPYFSKINKNTSYSRQVINAEDNKKARRQAGKV
jgi:hypothetical protein